ncbi:MAG TPA: hypothetical protein VMG33_12185 [Steroidobacteraceae bacterium]|nr:hypothetical protein [Steroidobacteraceae bacterium]
MDAEALELERFLAGGIAARDFPHREHVRMAHALLRRHAFDEATLRYANALRAMARAAGRPEAFNLTVTIAFLAVIGERLAGHEQQDFTSFAAANPDLFDKGMLRRWYRPEQLASPLARRQFLLPERSA